MESEDVKAEPAALADRSCAAPRRASKLYLNVDGRNGAGWFGWWDIQAASWTFLTLQLAVVCALIVTFQIEPRGLSRLLPFIFIGFILNSLAARKHRLPIFLSVSFATFLVILGGEALAYLPVAAALIGACHLPWRWRYRGMALAALGAVLAAVRLKAHTGGIVFSLIGSVFAFRLIIYLYDLRHERKRSSWMERFCYFFLLPNPVFLFFPVVDFATFRRTYYDSDAARIYQKGISWMVRGALQLLLYRLVYYRYAPAPDAVSTFWDVITFILTSYLLYLRVSGQFHLIAGILCMFGFNLPETHNRYYLASSFSDLWRRINIYWKDFMMKLCFYPVFMRLRKLGDTWAIALATAIVFAATWLLHSYYWFWLRGEFPIAWVDAIFWGVLGVLVIVNSLREARTSRSKRKGSAGSWRCATRISFQTLGMFVFMCVLWSLWNSASVTDWLAVVSMVQHGRPSDWLVLAGVLAAAGLFGACGAYWSKSRDTSGAAAGGLRESGQVLQFGVLTALVLAAWGLRTDTIRSTRFLPAEIFNTGSDERSAAHGYYETLLTPVPAGGALNEALQGAHRRGLLFPPNSEIVFNTAEFQSRARINSFGYRGTEIPIARTDAYRIIALGDSYTYGWGLNDGETWGEQLAGALRRRGLQVEIANLGRNGADVAQEEQTARAAIPLLKPDLVILGVAGDDFAQSALSRERASLEAQIPKDSWKGLFAESMRAMIPEVMAALRPPKYASSGTTVLGATWKEDTRNLLHSATAEQRARYARFDPEVQRRFNRGELNPVLLQLALQRPAYWRMTSSLAVEKSPLIREMGKRIARIRELAASHGARLLVVSLPFPAYVSETGVRRISRLGFDVDPDMLRKPALDDAFRLATRYAGTRLYTLTPEFRAMEERGIKLYYDFDSHLNPTGSELVARLLAPVVEKAISERTTPEHTD